MINKEIFLFFTIIFFIGYIFFDISEQTALLIFLSAIFLYLSLNRKNRYIGLPALVATFTVLFFLRPRYYMITMGGGTNQPVTRVTVQ